MKYQSVCYGLFKIVLAFFLLLHQTESRRLFKTGVQAAITVSPVQASSRPVLEPFKTEVNKTRAVSKTSISSMSYAQSQGKPRSVSDSLNQISFYL